MGTTGRTIRRAASFGAVTAVALVAAVGGAPPATARPGRAAATASFDREPFSRPRGFVPVHTTLGSVVGMTAPAPGELWVLEGDADGRVVLEHRSHGRWSVTRPGVALGRDAHVDGAAADDVWATGNGALFHWNGQDWNRVAVPDGLRAVTVTARRRGGAYVGLSGPAGSTAGVFQVGRGGARWRALGRPADLPTDGAPTWTATGIVVVRGHLVATWRKLAHSATDTQRAFAYRDGSWDDLGLQTFSGGGSRESAAWLMPDPALVLTLGEVDHGGSQTGVCRVWVDGFGVSACTTRWAVGAAALLGDGRVVVGGNDFRARPSDPLTPGTFGVRQGGGERVVPGDPGDRTVAMTVERGTDTAWAATVTGGVTTVQRWRP